MIHSKVIKILTETLKEHDYSRGPMGGVLTLYSLQEPYRKNFMITIKLYGGNYPSP